MVNLYDDDDDPEEEKLIVRDDEVPMNLKQQTYRTKTKAHFQPFRLDLHYEKPNPYASGRDAREKTKGRYIDEVKKVVLPNGD